MPPHLNRRTATNLPTGPLESIPLEGRSFVKGFRQYDSAIASIREFILPLSICRPIVVHFDSIDYAALDARHQLARALSSGRFDDLDERMKTEGIALEIFLQTRPEIDLSTLKTEHPLTNKIEEFFDRFTEAAMQPASDLASYLIRSKF